MIQVYHSDLQQDINISNNRGISAVKPKYFTSFFAKCFKFLYVIVILNKRNGSFWQASALQSSAHALSWQLSIISYFSNILELHPYLHVRICVGCCTVLLYGLLISPSGSVTTFSASIMALSLLPALLAVSLLWNHTYSWGPVFVAC